MFMECVTQGTRAVGQEFIDFPCLGRAIRPPKSVLCGARGAAIAGDQERPTHMSRSGDHTHTDAGGA